MSDRTIVLMYHRVAEEPNDPFALAIRPDDFAHQLAAVRRRAELIPFSEVQTPSRGPRVAVTLDDGYADNAHAALEVITAQAAPATFFVVSDTVGSPTSLWPLRLEHLFRREPRADTVTFTLDGHTFGADIRSPESRPLAMRFTHSQLRPRRVEEIHRVLDELDAQFHPGPSDERRMLTRDEVGALARNPMATLGAHTRTHPWLATLSHEEQLDELVGSRARLEELAGVPVDLLAYPFGNHDAYNHETVRAARKAGFRLACSTRQAPVLRGTSRYRIPRYAVIDRAGETFEERLERWLSH